MLKSHEFVIRIAGVPFKLQSAFTYSRDMALMGSAFEITLVDPDLSLIKSFRPGREVRIEIDGKVIGIGFLDVMTFDDSDGHVYKYIGRDRSADLIDCSAKFSSGGFERENITLEAALKDILSPFNMGLTLSGDTGSAFKKVSITPGETAINVIDRLCKYRALFPLSDGVGGLVVARAGQQKSSGKIIVGQNVIARTAKIDHTARYSEITITGNGNHSSFGDLSAQKLSEANGIAVDPDISRYRPLIIQSELEGFDLDMVERAKWEVRHRRFAGTEVTYTVPGWEAAAGEFWKINTIIPVQDKELNINRSMLIKGVSLTQDESGTKTQITLAPSEAYDIPPLREQASDDALFGGGA